MTVPFTVNPFLVQNQNITNLVLCDDSTRESASRARQHNTVIKHLLKTAMGDPQVHIRLRASPDFQAALVALDPDRPTFIEDERLRSVLQTGCLHIIDITAALLKFARENNIRMVP